MKLLIYAFPCKSIQVAVVDGYDPYGNDNENCKELVRQSSPSIGDVAKFARNAFNEFGDMDEIIIFGPYSYTVKFKEYFEEDYPNHKIRIVSPKRSN